MELPRFELADWIRRHEPQVRHNFGNSGIEPPNLTETGIDMDMEKFQRKHPTGNVGLEEVLAERYGVDPDNVLVTSSSSEAIYLVHRVLLQPGEGVVVPVPNYPAQLKVPLVVGAHVRPVELRFDEGWRPSMERVADAVQEKTRLLSVTNSHNPTGLMLSKHILEGLLEVAAAADGWLLVDEAFREFGFERAAPPAATLGERAISLGTMSKFYGVEDIRIGWVLAERDLVARLRGLKTWITSVNSRFGEYVARQVMEHHDWFVDRARRFWRENFEAVRSFVRSCKGLEWVEPDGSLLCFPRIVDGGSSEEFCRRLIEAGILLAPGSFFGAEGYLRLCFTRNPAAVREGLRALAQALNSAG